MSVQRTKVLAPALILLSVGLLPAISLAGTGTQLVQITSTTYTFDIPAQPLAEALRTVGHQTSTNVMFEPKLVKNLRAPPLRAQTTTAEAIRLLLVGTQLTAVQTAPDSILIETAPQASADPIGVPKSTAGATQSSSLQLAQNAGSTNAADEKSQESENRSFKLDEIVVTAQKREQNLIDVPISITAISGRKLEEAGIQDMQDLSFVVPSMAASEIGPGRQLIMLRGMGGMRGNSSLTGIYLDEMSVSGLQDGFIATYIDMGTVDLERVEVLKGPQGTLFGEGSVGGTVRFITKDPNLSGVDGSVSASLFGNDDSSGMSHELSGVLNLPVVEDKFGVRIVASYENEEGWIDKLQTENGPVIEEDFNDSELLKIRAKALWKVTDYFTVKGMAVINRNEGDGSSIVNLEPRSASNFIIAFEPTAPTGFSDDYDLYNLTATYDWSSMQLISATSYMDTDSVANLAQRKPLIPAPNPGFQELLRRAYGLTSKSFSQELRLSSKGTGPLTWTAGGYFKDSKLTQQDDCGIDFWRFGQPLRNSNCAVLQPADVSESKAWAAFGDISYALTANLEAGAGVRYFEDDRRAFGITGAGVVNPAQSATFDATTFRTYFSYAIADAVRMYGSVSTGFRSGGFNAPTVVALGAPLTFGPEDVISYELGTKMALAGGAVNLQAAVFYGKYDDVQINSIFFANNNSADPRAYNDNVGAADIKGVEWELNWAATDRLILGLSGDVIRTEFTEVDPRVQPPQFVLGDPIDFIPKYSVVVTADHKIQWFSSVPGHVRLQYSQKGESTNVLRTLGALEPITHTPVLNFMNASLGAHLSGWELELFGRNLLNEAGALRTGGGIEPQARPRTYGVRVTKAF